MFKMIERFFTHRKTRVKLIPGADGKPIPVKQVKALGLIWMTVESVENKRNNLRQEILEANRKIHHKMREEEDAAELVKAALDKVNRYGNQLTATGPVEEEKGTPFDVSVTPFIADPGKAFEEFRKKFNKGESTRPDGLPIWPPPDHDMGAGGQRTMYLLESQYEAAISAGLVMRGRDADEVMSYRKHQQQQSSKKGRGQQQGGQNNGNQNNGGQNNQGQQNN